MIACKPHVFNLLLSIIFISLLSQSSCKSTHPLKELPCLLHHVGVSKGNVTYNPFPQRLFTPLVIQTFGAQYQNTKPHEKIRNNFIKAANDKRSFTQSCYLQIYDVDSVINSNITNDRQNLYLYFIWTFVPHSTLIHKGLLVSPNVMFLQISRANLKSAVLEILIEKLWGTIYSRTNYFAMVEGECCALICLYCRSKFLKPIDLEKAKYPVHSYEQLSQLKNVWKDFNTNLKGIKVMSAEELVNRVQNSNCDLRLYKQGGHRPPQSYPWGCAGSYIARKFNFSRLENNDVIPSYQRPNLAFVFSNKMDLVWSRKYSHIQSIRYAELTWEYFCIFRQPYVFQIFVHKNITSLNLMYSLKSAFEPIFSCLTLTSILLVSSVSYIAIKSTQNEDEGNVSLFNTISFTLCALLNQVDPHYMNRFDRLGNFFKFGIAIWILTAMLISALHCGEFLSFLTVKQLPVIPRNLRELVLSQEEFKNIPVITTSGVTTIGNGHRTMILLQLIFDFVYLENNSNESLVKLKQVYCALYSKIVSRLFVLNPWINYHVFVTNITYGTELIVRFHHCSPNLTLRESNGTFIVPPVFAVLDFADDVKLIKHIAENIGEYENVQGYQGVANDVDVGHGDHVLVYESKFMSSFVHNTLGWMDNTGLYRRWVNQYIDHLRFTDEASLKFQHSDESMLFYKKMREKKSNSQKLAGLALKEIQFVFELCISLCFVALLILILEGMLVLYRLLNSDSGSNLSWTFAINKRRVNINID